MLSECQGFLFPGRVIFCRIGAPALLYSFTCGRCLGRVRIVAAVNSAAVNVAVHVSFQFSVFVVLDPEVELPGCRAVPLARFRFLQYLLEYRCRDFRGS